MEPPGLLQFFSHVGQQGRFQLQDFVLSCWVLSSTSSFVRIFSSSLNLVHLWVQWLTVLDKGQQRLVGKTFHPASIHRMTNYWCNIVVSQQPIRPNSTQGWFCLCRSGPEPLSDGTFSRFQKVPLTTVRTSALKRTSDWSVRSEKVLSGYLGLWQEASALNNRRRSWRRW